MKLAELGRAARDVPAALTQVVNPKVARFVWNHYVSGRPHPFSVTLNVTTACNLRCAYCDIPRQPRQEPPLADLRRLVRALGPDTLHWNLTGGEPLRRPDLGEIVDAIKDTEAPTYLTMFSNGHDLRARRDAVRRVDEVFLTLDGSPAYHDARRGRGAHAATLDAMEALAEQGTPYSATCVLTRDSEAELDYIFALAARRGFKVGFIPVRVYSRSPEQMEALLPTPAQFARMIQRIRRFPLTSNSPAGLDQLSRWPQEPRLSRPCKGGATFFTLEADGRLYRCCERRPEHQLPDPVAPERVRDWIRRLPHAPCHGCWNIEGLELNRMFQLEPGALWNLLRGARISQGMRPRISA